VTKSTLLQTLIRNALIVILLLVLILAPRPAAGYFYLTQAELRSVGHVKLLDIAPYYALAAGRIPWRPDLYERAGLAYFNGRAYGTAIPFFQLALQYHALSSDGRMAWGNAVYLHGNVTGAIAIWEDALKQENPDPYLHSYLGDGYEKIGNYGGAIQEFKAFLQVHPDSDRDHYQLGLLYAATTPEKALPELMRAVQLNPTMDASVESLRSALNTASLSDDSAYQLLVSGRALGALGNWDLAAEAFRNAIAVRTDYADAWAWLGEAKQQQGQDGSVEIKRAIALNPNSALVESLFGLYLERQKQPKQALAAIQKAAALEPGNPGWQMALGEAYEQTGDLVSALQYYQKATELSPQDATFWRALAEFSLRNNLDLAGTGLPAARRLVELSNNDWQSDDIAGQMLLEMDDPVGAEVLLKKAIELDPTQAAPFLHLGFLYLQTGDRTAAFSYLNQAKSGFDPDGSIGWQASRLLEKYFP
jgi:tetratricopeptide (TPR) repeat protein